MLVLTRKNREEIRIGNDITISIIKIKGNSVRIGIDAPRDVQVLRGELPRFEDCQGGTDDSADTKLLDASDEDETTVMPCEWEGGRQLSNRRPCLPVREVLNRETRRLQLVSG